MPGALAFFFSFSDDLNLHRVLKVAQQCYSPIPTHPHRPLAWFLFLSVTLFILYLFILLEYSCFTMLR